MKELIIFDKDVREVIKETVGIMARAVKSTLGPKGNNVGVFSDTMQPNINNDGVTVAKRIKFNDEFKNYIADVVKTSSNNTEKLIGDGTSTSITLLEAMVNGAYKYIDAGYLQVSVIKGMRSAMEEVMQLVDEKALPIDDNLGLLEKVASISANNDKELGKLIADTFKELGSKASIEIDISQKGHDYVEVADGVKYESGFLSNMFVNTSTGDCVLESPYIFLYEGRLKPEPKLFEVLNEVGQNGDSILIIADDFSEEVKNALTAAKINTKMKVCAVQSPGYGEKKEINMDDLSFLTGADIISKRFGSEMDDLEMGSLGRAARATIDSGNFSFTTDFVSKGQILERVGDDTDKERVSRLTSGLATLYVIGKSPIETSEKTYRAEDAINAVRVAMEGGVLPGGGTALYKIAKQMEAPKWTDEAEMAGHRVIMESLTAPIRTILENANENFYQISNQLEDNFNHGYDAMEGTFGDLYELGVVDPKNVTKAALSSSFSVAAMLIGMNSLICNQ